MAKKPAKKPTKQEKQERVDLTTDLLSRGWYIHEIRRKLQDEYNVTRRTCDRYLSHAREALAESWGVTIDELRTAQAAFYRHLMKNEDLDAGVRLKAAQRIDKLFGLETHLPDYREKLRELGIDPDEAVQDISRAIGNALGNAATSKREN